MEALTDAERDRIHPLLPHLERAALDHVRRGHGYDANYSAGFDGLIHYLRTPPIGDPSKWLDLCLRNAIRGSWRKGRRYTDRATPHEDVEGPAQPEPPKLSPLYDLADELPPYLRDVVQAMLLFKGNKDDAARYLSISRRDINERLQIILERSRPN